MDLFISGKKSITSHRSICPQVLEYADKNREEGCFVDVTVLVDNLKIPANRLVLSCCSKVFEKMFKSQMKERYERTVNVTAEDGESVKLLIDFMYSGSISVNNENVLRLLAAADFLQMEEVKLFCSEFLEAILTPAICYSILSAANLYQLEPLQHSIYKMISVDFDQFVQTDDFLSFTKDEVQHCISKLDRAKVKETSVFDALVTWTKHDETKRGKYFPDLFKLVQLNEFSYQFLRKVVSEQDLVSKNLLCSSLVTTCLFELLDNKTKTQDQDLSKIFSIGGQKTSGRLIEVFNCEQRQPAIDLDLGKDINHGQALKHGNQIYYIAGSVFDMHSGPKISNINQIKINKNTAAVEVVGSLNQPRIGFAAATFDDALIVSGCEKILRGARPSTECFLPQLNKCKLIAPTNLAKNSNVLVHCEGCLYDVGGWNDLRPLSDVERLRGLNENWEFVEPTQMERMGHTAVAYNGYIYAIGGRTFPIAKKTQSVEKYNPSSNKWAYVKNMKFDRSGHVACVLKDKIYVVGGKNSQGQFVREIECYDPSIDVWSVVGIAPVELYNHSLVIL